MNKLLEAALDYAEQGWPIFPCRIDKKPYTTHGVLDATTRADQINKWWSTWPNANIGLDVGGAGMMVVDLDPGHDYDELDRNVGGLPETELVATTPRGEHLFFKLNKGDIVSPSANKLAPHVDVRSFNSYVLLAPSVTADGSYSWESKGKAPLATKEMIRLSNSYREKSGDRDNWIIEPDLPENKEAAATWLATKAKIAIEGQGGDHTAYATAAHMKSFGLSEPMALELMWEHWNPRCIPPWTADEHDHLEIKVRNAYSYNTSPPGNITPAYTVALKSRLFKPVVRETKGGGREIGEGRFRFVDRDAMDAIQPPEWLIKGLIPEQSYAILFGAFSTHKTFVALDMALTLAAGFVSSDQSYFADRVDAPGNVLFLAGEGRAMLTRRVEAWEKIHMGGIRTQRFILGDPVPHINEPDQGMGQFIADALELSPDKDGYDLVVIDTIGRAMQGVNENAQEHASQFTRMVETLQREFGGAVLAIHHTGHADKNRERGSVVFGADADARFRIECEENSRRVTVKTVKQKDAEEAKPFHLNMIETTVKDNTSLVSVIAPHSPEETNTKHGKNAKAPTPEKIEIELIDKVVMEILNKYPLNYKLKNAALADAIYSDTENGIDREYETIKTAWLKKLRGAKGTRVAKAKAYVNEGNQSYWAGQNKDGLK